MADPLGEVPEDPTYQFGRTDVLTVIRPDGLQPEAARAYTIGQK